MYKILLLDQDELVIYKVNEINWDVIAFIKWRYPYELVDILSGKDAEQCEPNYYCDSKEDILEQLNRICGVNDVKINYLKEIVNKYFI